MTYWRQAGLTYLQFSSIAARAVRNALKPEFRPPVDPTRPEGSTIKQTLWKDGKPIKSQ